MATLGLPGGPPRLHIPAEQQECPALAGLAAGTPRVCGEEPLACSLSVSHDNSMLDAAAGEALAAEAARETTDQVGLFCKLCILILRRRYSQGLLGPASTSNSNAIHRTVLGAAALCRLTRADVWR